MNINVPCQHWGIKPVWLMLALTLIENLKLEPLAELAEKKLIGPLEWAS